MNERKRKRRKRKKDTESEESSEDDKEYVAARQRQQQEWVRDYMAQAAMLQQSHWDAMMRHQATMMHQSGQYRRPLRPPRPPLQGRNKPPRLQSPKFQEDGQAEPRLRSKQSIDDIIAAARGIAPGARRRTRGWDADDPPLQLRRVEDVASAAGRRVTPPMPGIMLGMSVGPPRQGGAPEVPPPKAPSGTWEVPRTEIGLTLLADLAKDTPWTYAMKDESRRSFAAYLPGSIDSAASAEWFARLRDGVMWDQPKGPLGPIPRKTAWLVAEPCTCTYRYGGVDVAPQPYPPWMLELMRLVMPKCGLHELHEFPNSCNMNLYEDGTMSVGWHSDDESLFQGKFTDCRIISLTFGVRRRFELRLNWPEPDEPSLHGILLGDGDLCTMEGMTQKHFQHRLAREAHVTGPRINLTWRWILKHNPQCPSSRTLMY